MKLSWLPLLILSTHLGVLTPRALAFESEPTTKMPIENVDASTISVDKLVNLEDSSSQWVESGDAGVALEKGFRRRRFGSSRFRSGRFRRDIFFRNGGFHRTQFRYGEFRRDGIFFRHGGSRHHNFNNIRSHRDIDAFHDIRFRHGGFRRNNFRHDRFRRDGSYRIRIH